MKRIDIGRKEIGINMESDDEKTILIEICYEDEFPHINTVATCSSQQDISKAIFRKMWMGYEKEYTSAIVKNYIKDIFAFKESALVKVTDLISDFDSLVDKIEMARKAESVKHAEGMAQRKAARDAEDYRFYLELRERFKDID